MEKEAIEKKAAQIKVPALVLGLALALEAIERTAAKIKVTRTLVS